MTTRESWQISCSLLAVAYASILRACQNVEIRWGAHAPRVPFAAPRREESGALADRKPSSLAVRRRFAVGEGADRCTRGACAPQSLEP